MKVICATLAVVAILFFMGVFSSQDEIATSLIEQSSGPVPGAEGISGSVVVQRVVAEGSGEDFSWRDELDRMPEFQRRFVEIYFSEGGEDAARAHIKKQTEDMKSSGYWDSIPFAVSEMNSSGMAISNESQNLFLDAVYAEHYHVAGLLTVQVQNWRQWKEHDDGEGLYDPFNKLVSDPLNFPPEIHFFTMRDMSNRTEYSSELLLQAAELRDRLVRKAGAIELERYTMLGSIQQTIRETGFHIPENEWEEAVTFLLPDYFKIREAQEVLEQEYLDSLRFLLAEYGY